MDIVLSLGYKFLYYEYYLWVGSLYLGIACPSCGSHHVAVE
ncbi:hypothetical protein Stok01_01210 [Sulfurisphaera tokodaii]